MIRYRLVTDSHYVCQKPGAKLPPGARRFLATFATEGSNGAYIATEGGDLVGFLRYDWYRRCLYAYGTWVRPSHRARGIGRRLWIKALTGLKPKGVEVSTMTPRGAQLVASLRRRYPDISWRWLDLSRPRSGR